MPRLPSELWLRIFEQLDDVEFLWCTLRSVSKDYRAFVDRIFAATFLASISCSLSLPRLDPKTGRARYTRPVPGAEVTLHCRKFQMGMTKITLATPTKVSSGETIQQLTASEALSKQRLDEAQVWMWFGRQRGKGANVAINKDLQWDEEEKAWVWSVQWESLVNKYFRAKTRPRRTQRKMVCRNSVPSSDTSVGCTCTS